MLHAIERERLEQLFECENLLRCAGVPAEQREVVEQRLGEVAAVPEQDEVCLGVLALGELGAVGGEDQRHVRVCLRTVITKRVDQHQLVGRVGEVLLTSDDVGDLHHRIVDRACELVDRIAVRFHDDEVADQVGVELHLAADHVRESDLTPWHLESHGEHAAALRRILQAAA